VQRKRRLAFKRPEIQKCLDAVNLLLQRQEAGESVCTMGTAQHGQLGALLVTARKQYYSSAAPGAVTCILQCPVGHLLLRALFVSYLPSCCHADGIGFQPV
jgi:hypothetical protein